MWPIKWTCFLLSRVCRIFSNQYRTVKKGTHAPRPHRTCEWTSTCTTRRHTYTCATELQYASSTCGWTTAICTVSLYCSERATSIRAFREREITLYFNLSRGHGHLTEGTTRVTLPYPNAEVPHLGVQWRWQYIGRCSMSDNLGAFVVATVMASFALSTAVRYL